MTEESYSEDDLPQTVSACYTRARDASSTWRSEEMRDSFDMRAGHQWKDEDKALMESQRRPCVTFNRIAPILEAVSGQEANSRHETAFKPRGVEDSGFAESIDLLRQFQSQGCDAPYEEGQAFADLLAAGMGWTGDRVDYECDPEGQWIRERVDPGEMFWDPAAKKKNLSDARWLLRRTRVDSKLLELKYPKIKDVQAEGETFMAEPSDDDQGDHLADLAYLYTYGKKGQVAGTETVVEYQWYELVTEYRVIAPGFPVTTLDETKFKKGEKRLESMGAQWARVQRKKYMRALLARNQVVEKGPSPVDGFTYHCITGRWDRNKRMFYGMVRDLKDPQRWANKFFSSMLDIVSVNSKGGIMAEEGAFKDPRKAEEDWSNPGKVVLMTQGAISGNRVKERPRSEYPSSMDKLLAFAVSSLRDVSGVNVELLGMADRDQPGIVEAQRKQSALAILAPFFDALKSYRKTAGQCQLQFIRRWMPDAVMQRVLPQEYHQYIPAIRDEKAIKFDVIVDESPVSPNQKEQTMAVLAQFLPEAMKMGIMPPPEVLDYLPLPKPFVEKWKAKLSQPDPMAEQMKMLDLEEKKAGIDKDKSQAAANMGRAQQAMKQDPRMEMQMRIAEMQAELQKMQAELQMKREEHQQEMQFRVAEHQMDMAVAQSEQAMQMQHAEQEHAQSMAINEQAGAAKIEQMKRQQAAKPQPNGDARG